MAVKFSLRKANAIQQNIQDLLNKIQVKTSVELNEFQDPVATLQAANDAVMAADVRRSDLLMALYSIRATVGSANFSSGIGNRLSHLAYIDKRLGQLDSLVSEGARLKDLAVITGQIEKIKNRREEHRMYGMSDGVTSGVLQQSQMDSIAGIMRELKKQKQKLNDEVLELNVRTEIEVTDDVEAVLVKEGIL
jgi:polyhydroxyalkanoate synthesis regulator phasin